MEPLIIPLWAISLASFISILGVLFSLKFKKSIDSRIRSITSLIPKIYFFVLYTLFWLENIPVETRSIYGRYGIFAILAVDGIFLLEDIWNYYKIGEKLARLYKILINNFIFIIKKIIAKIQIRRGNL